MTFAETRLEGCRFPGAMSDCDFALTNLRGWDLSGKVLHGSSFDEAKMRGARLFSVELLGARLCDADLRDCNLEGSSLACADLSDAKLQGANLRDCDLGMAFLVRTKLAGAKLARARFHRTILADVDLSRVEGLPATRHEGPSSVSTDALERTLAAAAEDARRLQEVQSFFRAAGVSERLLDHCLWNADRPPPYLPARILHDKSDAGFAQTLYEELQAQGVRCWKHARGWRATSASILERRWNRGEKVIFCVSRTALASEWAPLELEFLVTGMGIRGIEDVIAVDLDGCLSDMGRAADAVSTGSWGVADWSRVASGEGELGEAVERVLEELRDG